MRWSRTVVVAAVLAVCAGCGAPAPPPVAAPQEPPVPATPCLARLSIDHASSVLAEQRRVGPPAPDFPTRYRAVDLDPDVQVPVEAVRQFQIGQTPLLWFTADRTEAVVNAAVLTDLTVADLTQAAPGTRVEIGQLSELGLGHIDGRALVEFLLRARVIATYAHLGSELCLVEERNGPEGYRARFTGSHTYVTSRRHVAPLAFTVTVDADGRIAAQAD